MNDFLGNVINIGDEVVAMVRRGERSKELIRGLVLNITPKRVEIYQLGIGERVIDLESIKDWKVKKVEPSRVVKVNTGNIELSK